MYYYYKRKERDYIFKKSSFMDNTPPPSKEANQESDCSSLLKLPYLLDGVFRKAPHPEDR